MIKLYIISNSLSAKKLFQISTDVPADVEHASMMIEVDADIFSEGLLQNLLSKTIDKAY